MTKFGDWFFVNSKGHVFFLDLIEGELNEVAFSIEEFNKLKNTKAKQTEWYLDGFVFRCYDENLRLKEGECYGWKIHPMIGGKFEFENIQVFSILVYQSLMGQLLPQWKKNINAEKKYRQFAFSLNKKISISFRRDFGSIF